MENQIYSNEQTNANLSETMIDNIKKTSAWMKFMAVVAFIFSVLLFIRAISIIVKFGKYVYYYNAWSPLIIFFTLIHIVAAIVMLFAGLYLLKCANSYNEYCLIKNSNLLEKAFLMQQKFWKIVGVFTIIIFLYKY